MMASYGNPLMPIEKSLIDRCISLVYRDYLKNPRPENMPVLGDLYQCLREQHNSRADDLATAMEIYVTGSLSYLNHRTNVDGTHGMGYYRYDRRFLQLCHAAMLVLCDDGSNAGRCFHPAVGQF